jgi:hypothetical protein
MKFRAEHERGRDLLATVLENRHGYSENFFDRREAYTSVFCGSVFDILRFLLVIGEDCSSEWRWVVGTPSVSLIGMGTAVPRRPQSMECHVRADRTFLVFGRLLPAQITFLHFLNSGNIFVTINVNAAPFPGAFPRRRQSPVYSRNVCLKYFR